MVRKNRFSVSVCCSCKFLNCAANEYSNLHAPNCYNCQNIHPSLSNTLLAVEIYTTDSAIYSLQSQQQVCMSYTTTCGAFDLPSISRATAHERSQFKPQKLRMGGYTEKELKWFNYPRVTAHPGCEVTCQGYQIDLHRRFVRTLSRPARQ